MFPDSQYGLCVHEPTAAVISTEVLNKTTPRSVGIPAENANWTQWATKKNLKKKKGGHKGRGNGKDVRSTWQVGDSSRVTMTTKELCTSMTLSNNK